MIQFRTPKLFNSPLASNYATFAAGLYQNERVMRKIGPVMDKSQSTLLIDNAVALNRNPNSLCKVWVIENFKTKAPVGIQMLKWHGHGSDSAEIGIMLLPNANGKGFAIEGMGALVDVGFSHFCLSKIFAWFHPTNLAVKRFVKQLGFRVEDADKNDNIGKSYCEITRSEWQRIVSAEIVSSHT